MENTQEKEKILALAEKIKLLFAFCSELIPDKDLIKKSAEGAGEKASMAGAMAVLMPFDYEKVEFDANLVRRRAEALFKLVEIIEKTELERIEMKRHQQAEADGRRQIAQMFGI